MSDSKRARRLSYERRVMLAAIATAAPGVVVACFFIWHGSSLSTDIRVLLTIALLAAWISAALILRNSIVRPLQTTTNMVAALREEDFTFRARGANRDDALGELVLEINLLADALQHRRSETVEAVALLKKVIMEIDVAVFTFDQSRRLTIVNRAGEQLLAMRADQLLGKTAAELALESLLSEPHQTAFLHFAGKEGRWAISYSKFRENGIPHELLIVSDLSRALREQERQAWQRIIRVLGHELNNSLAPIKSIAGTLAMLASRQGLDETFQQDLRGGLDIIATRADALSRFMQAYTRLAKLPAPNRTRVNISQLVHRVAAMERRVAVAVTPGENLAIYADGDQLEQLLINIVRNAADACLDASLRVKGSVTIEWKRNGSNLTITIVDEGPGLPNSTNLFVPFFTTKPEGSGIGLVLSRQIAETHGGELTLVSRTDAGGCEAKIILPFREDSRR